jgi:hypothetical protein
MVHLKEWSWPNLSEAGLNAKAARDFLNGDTPPPRDLSSDQQKRSRKIRDQWRKRISDYDAAIEKAQDLTGSLHGLSYQVRESGLTATNAIANKNWPHRLGRPRMTIPGAAVDDQSNDKKLPARFLPGR